MTLEAQLKDAVTRSHSDSQIQRAIHLLNQGADPNIGNGWWLCRAIDSQNEALVRAFLSHGAKVTAQAMESALRGNLWDGPPQTSRMSEILLNHGADHTCPN